MYLVIFLVDFWIQFETYVNSNSNNLCLRIIQNRDVGARIERCREAESKRRSIDKSHWSNWKMANMDMFRNISRKVSSGLASDEHYISSATHEFHMRELWS
ncbi:unnamed protein product [Parnassius mnemosyne]|uniref:Uncharacterized protein n=1 Tax=Parnassius mnemosyne TaxID=213953 RepID=A0AAV1KRY0_9NEOP